MMRPESMTSQFRYGTLLRMKTTKTRLRKTQDPCTGCRMHQSYCICSSIPNIEVPTLLTLVIHAKELKRTSNTGSLSVKALKNSQIIVRGQDRTPLDLTQYLSPDHEPILFYPGPDSVDIKEYLMRRREVAAENLKPIQLIVPDGNWRQASKVASRHPELRSLPRVQVSEKNLATQHLRKEHFEQGMSTLEAIACAFHFLEGPIVGQALKDLYQLKLHRTLQARGQFILDSSVDMRKNL